MNEQQPQTEDGYWVEEIEDPVTGEIVVIKAATEAELETKVNQIYPQDGATPIGEA